MGKNLLLIWIALLYIFRNTNATPKLFILQPFSMLCASAPHKSACGGHNSALFAEVTLIIMQIGPYMALCIYKRSTLKDNLRAFWLEITSLVAMEIVFHPALSFILTHFHHRFFMYNY
ncbi:MAG: hypothetical protein IJI71_08860 [Clostridia bacterium]|nr:hypothetical protein [Clostridia bacterium]